MFKSLPGLWVGLLFAAAGLVLGTPTVGAAETATQPEIRFAVRWHQRAEGAERAVATTGERQWTPGETAIVVCDVWNQHWCASATRRCGELAEKMAPIIDTARARGVRIVHAPSDTMDFYRDHPARRRALAVALVEPPSPIGNWCSLDKAREGNLPIDDSDGGCDCQPQCKNYKAWTRQHPAITIDAGDLVCDDGRVVYSYFVEHGIKNVIYVGVHTNMCVLGRSFGIRQMTKLGLNAVLVRDLTDTMYNPRKAPFVDHAAGTELVVKHVEEHWCPSTISAALAQGLRP